MDFYDFFLNFICQIRAVSGLQLKILIKISEIAIGKDLFSKSHFEYVGQSTG